MNLSGGCLCAEVRYFPTEKPLWIAHCHCQMCRRQTGAAVATYVGFPAGSVVWTAAQPTRFRSSKDVERSFCPVCGSTIGFHRVHETSLALGTFDRPDELARETIWRGHVWYKDHIIWFDTADDWPRFPEFPAVREATLAALSGQPIRG
jgi:hypothetical protein